MGSLDYRSAGVDIGAGEEAVRRIKRHVALDDTSRGDR